MKQSSAFFLVGIGGFLGSTARYGVSLLLSSVAGGLPLATFSVNIAGCFFIGLFSELAVSTTLVSPESRLFLVTGFCGGFTTFSSYIFENASLLKDGQLLYASVYLAGSVIGGFVALYSGTLIAKIWT
ncbi:MAG: fluoride efflux transporter CrcB [Chlorobiaceae bacterium]|jgi:fluoride exporter|nr:fluoride efflux transporter CrcB [Chlorobiaceae bacterium]